MYPRVWRELADTVVMLLTTVFKAAVSKVTSNCKKEISCQFLEKEERRTLNTIDQLLTSLPDKNMAKILLEVCQSTWGTGKWLEIANMASKKANCAWLIWSSFYDAVTALVTKQLMLSTLTFGRPWTWFPHNNWVAKLEWYGFDGWTIHWMRNGLDNQVQRVEFNGSISKWISVKNGVPQWPVWGTSTIWLLQTESLADVVGNGIYAKYFGSFKSFLCDTSLQSIRIYCMEISYSFAWIFRFVLFFFHESYELNSLGC